LASVTDTLLANRIIDSPRWFRLYATMRGEDRSIQAGIYDLRPGSSPREVLRALVAGAAASQRLVIPEGMMLSEVVNAVEQQLGIPAESTLVASQDSQLLASLGIEAETLEGYLYPSTYFVRVGVGARDVVRQMVAEFETQWDPAWDARLDTLGLSRHEAVILASIIEGEVLDGRDRKFVSSVYHNRLNTPGWRLQADPTVIYALGRRRRLYQRDYEFQSPYNTYQVDGLPPGPIGQPSAASIEAALYPERTDFFFFVAQPDGQHVFSRTLREHNAAVARVREQERRGGLR
jgi:UPF0755 protein